MAYSDVPWHTVMSRGISRGIQWCPVAYSDRDDRRSGRFGPKFKIYIPRPMSSAYTKKAKLSVLSYQYKPQAYTGWVPSFRNSIYPNPNTGPHTQTRTQTDRKTHRQIVFLYIDKQSNQLHKVDVRWKPMNLTSKFGTTNLSNLTLNWRQIILC